MLLHRVVQMTQFFLFSPLVPVPDIVMTAKAVESQSQLASSSFVSSVGSSSSITSQIDIPDEPNHPKT